MKSRQKTISAVLASIVTTIGALSVEAADGYAPLATICKPSGFCMQVRNQDQNIVRVVFSDDQGRATHFNYKKPGGPQSEVSKFSEVALKRRNPGEVVDAQWCVRPTIGRSECGPWERFPLYGLPIKQEAHPPARKPVIVGRESSTGQVEARPKSFLASPCAQGFVWREASKNDFVCVTPEVRTRSADENRKAATRWDPSGAYGPKSCIAGFVWREAFGNDQVCVTPEIRAQVRRENELSQSRRASP